MRQIGIYFLILICLISCKKQDTAQITSIDYSGKYQGQVMVTNSGSNSTFPYDMGIDIYKGNNDTEIKILFGVWLSIATLQGSKFTIQTQTFSGNVIISGNGEFNGTKVTMHYIQGTSLNSLTNSYSGILTKL